MTERKCKTCLLIYNLFNSMTDLSIFLISVWEINSRKETKLSKTSSIKAASLKCHPSRETRGSLRVVRELVRLNSGWRMRLYILRSFWWRGGRWRECRWWHLRSWERTYRRDIRSKELWKVLYKILSVKECSDHVVLFIIKSI